MKTLGAFVLGLVLGGATLSGAQSWEQWQQIQQMQQAAERAAQNQRIMNGQHPMTGEDMTGRHRNPC